MESKTVVLRRQNDVVTIEPKGKFTKVSYSHGDVELIYSIDAYWKIWLLVQDGWKED